MDKKQMEEWLDRLVANKEEAIELSSFGDEVIMTMEHETKIFIYKGIDVIADTMGLELIESKRVCDTYPYEYSLHYKGSCLYQIEEERFERFA